MHVKHRGTEFQLTPEVPVTECLLVSPWGMVKVQDGVPLRSGVGREMSYRLSPRGDFPR